MKKLLYAAVDVGTLNRGVKRTLNGAPIRFPARWSRFYPPVYQPELAAQISAHCRPGTTAVDVGAHLGVFSVPMARAVGEGGRILAFEPTDLTRGALYEVARMNGVAEWMEIRPEAVSDREGELEFFIGHSPVGNGNSLIKGAGAQRTTSVLSISLDQMIPPAEETSFIKIDAEGAELAVLQGARRILADWRPAIAMDVHAGLPAMDREELAALWAEIEAAGYRATHRGQLIVEEEFVGAGETLEVLMTAEA